jgi:hypothetical protein
MALVKSRSGRVVSVSDERLSAYLARGFTLAPLPAPPVARDEHARERDDEARAVEEAGAKPRRRRRAPAS